MKTITTQQVRAYFHPRMSHTHKGDYGHLLAIGGSANKPGAILMSGRAALRTGAGLVTVALPDRAFKKLSKNFLELMYEPFPSTSQGFFRVPGTKEMQRVLQGKNAIVVGPGMGTGAKALLRTLLRVAEVPMVLDADALNVLSALDKRVLSRVPPSILTPHPGEMPRLTGLTTAEIQKDRVGCAGRFAKKWRVILVLKGFRTVVAMPDGRVFINPTGNPGMATAGMGDVLTGVIGGLLAQGLAPEQATIAGVFVHGLAGDRVARRLGDRGLLASDVIEELPLTFKKLIP